MIRSNKQKMLKIKIILSLLLCSLVFSCSAPIKKDEQKTNQCTKYACPMHPDKTSTKPDQCPECNMQMVPADSIAKDSVMLHTS